VSSALFHTQQSTVGRGSYWVGGGERPTHFFGRSYPWPECHNCFGCMGSEASYMCQQPNLRLGMYLWRVDLKTADHRRLPQNTPQTTATGQQDTPQNTAGRGK